MGWRGFVDDERRVVFFWSQKAACTSLFKVIGDNLAEPPAHKMFFHKNSIGVHACVDLIRKKGYRSVILVRHPTLRIISAYFNKFCIYEGKPLKERGDLEVFAQPLHDIYCSLKREQTDANTMSFIEFLDVVAHVHAKRPKPKRPINGHWDTQIPAFLARKGFAYDCVLHVETFDQEMSALASDLDMTFVPHQLNKTPVAEADEFPVFLGNVPARDVTKQPFGYRNFINDVTLAKIGRIYGVDFKAFGYDLNPYAEPQKLVSVA